MRLRGGALAFIAAMGIAGASTLPPVTPQEARDPDPSSADSLDSKLQLIRQRHTDGAKDPKRFHVSEEEANAYLVYRLAEHLPAEVTDPWVRFGVDQIQGGAMLDASLLGTHLSDSYLAKYLEGQVPVEVLAQVHAEAGVGQVELESVTLSGIPIPRTLVQKLVSDYSKNPSLPNGVRLDDPFPLPYGIVSARFRSGKLILRQGPTQGDDETRSASSAH